MADSTTTLQINLKATAETSQARNDYDAFFSDMKQSLSQALEAGGADKKFIGHVVDEFDRLNATLKETGASGEEVAEKIAQLQQKLMEDAAAEERRIRQLKVNFEVALEEKKLEEEAATLKRIRREEDQLAMEQEGIRLKEQTELLEQQIMARLKQERLAREAVESTKSLGSAMQGAKRDIGGAALTAAYFVDDLQYGLKGIINNIPQLLMGFGLGTGLTGVVSIAAVAVNLLWEKFGGAKEAKAETDKVTDSLEDMQAALKRTAEASKAAFDTDLSRYADNVERAVTAWQKIKGEVSSIVDYHKALAEAQNQMANSQLEIERQNALANAKTSEEKSAINSQFDARKSAINSAGALEQAGFNLEAQKAQDELLRRQFGNVSRQKDDAEGRKGQAEIDARKLAENYGDRSDQGKHVAEAEAAQKRLLDLQRQQREMEEFNRARPAMNSGDAMARAARAQQLQEEIDKASSKRDQTQIGLAADREALSTGKGLTFTKLQEEAAEKAKQGIYGTAKLYEQVMEDQQKINAEREAAEKALIKATEELKQLREAQAESERQLVLRRKQLEAAELKDTEEFAKAGAAAAQAKREADEKAVKDARDEQRRKLENDAAEAERRGDHTTAAKKKNEADKLKLGPDATPEEERAAAIAARERMEEARKKQAKGQPEAQVDASNIIAPLSNLAGNLGSAGKGLADAVAKLKDGATEKELNAVVQNVIALGPLLKQRFGSQDARIAQLNKAVEQLKAQVRSAQL